MLRIYRDLLVAISGLGGRGFSRAGNSAKCGFAGASPSRCTVWKCALLCLPAVLGGFPVHAQDDLPSRQIVVKVFCTSNQLSLGSPWKRDAVIERSGSGIWLGENRILTNEHLVNYPTQISVQPYESAARIPASVVVACPEMDLAIIEIDGDFPYKDLAVPNFAPQLPPVKSTVRVYGFPEGGQSISVTEGIVSRIEYRPYAYGEAGLRIQVDAAINPGNSGGPAYVADQIVGVAFQRRSRSDNIGYLIPCEEVLRFLENAKNGTDMRKPELPIRVQSLVNADLRRSLALSSETTGVWVREVIGVEDFPIKVGDILTHIGDYPIDNNGQTRLAADLLVEFPCLLPRLATDGTVPIRLIRDGTANSVMVPVRQPQRQLFSPLKGTYPEYFVYGPLVLVPAYTDFLDSIEAASAMSDDRARLSALAAFRTFSLRNSPLVTRRTDRPAFDDEELVMVVNWLPHRMTIGYRSPATQIIDEVNGTKIRNLKHLVATLRDLKDEYVELKFVDVEAETLVFDRAQLIQATGDILLNNGIPRQGSPDVLQVWTAGDATSDQPAQPDDMPAR